MRCFLLQSAHNRGSDPAEELRGAEELLIQPENGSSTAVTPSSHDQTRRSSNGAVAHVNGATERPSVNGAVVVESPGVEVRVPSANGASANGAYANGVAARSSSPVSSAVSSNGVLNGAASNGATPRIIPAGCDCSLPGRRLSGSQHQAYIQPSCPLHTRLFTVLSVLMDSVKSHVTSRPQFVSSQHFQDENSGRLCHKWRWTRSSDSRARPDGRGGGGLC